MAGLLYIWGMGKKINLDVKLATGPNEEFAPGSFKEEVLNGVPVSLNFNEVIGMGNGRITSEGRLFLEVETDFDVDLLVGKTETSFAYSVDWANADEQITTKKLESISFIPKITLTEEE